MTSGVIGATSWICDGTGDRRFRRVRCSTRRDPERCLPRHRAVRDRSGQADAVYWDIGARGDPRD